MADYISRDEVLEHSEYTGNFNLVVPVRFIKAMKASDVQPVDRWIKADVSLPVYDGMVLVCDKSKNIRLGIYTDMGWCSQFGNPMMCKITHWQPLPEPPKDGGAE